MKRLQELQCHKNNYNTKESKLQQPLLQSEQNGDKSEENSIIINETVSDKSMGSNVTTAKGGLSGRRTQSQSKFIVLFHSCMKIINFNFNRGGLQAILITNRPSTMASAVRQNIQQRQSAKIAISLSRISIRNQHLAIKTITMSILMELARL